MFQIKCQSIQIKQTRGLFLHVWLNVQNSLYISAFSLYCMDPLGVLTNRTEGGQTSSLRLKSGYQKQKAEREEKGQQLVTQFIQRKVFYLFTFLWCPLTLSYPVNHIIYINSIDQTWNSWIWINKWGRQVDEPGSLFTEVVCSSKANANFLPST